MIQAFLTGFVLGTSLIFAIGPQNAFVIRQGILRQHVLYVALFCSISDALLILIGISSISYFLADFFTQFSSILFGLSALWLIGYGAIRLSTLFRSNSALELELQPSKNLISTLSFLFVITFANPHVYLDTVILIGSISQQFYGDYKIAFALGASIASFTFFFTLAYGAKLFSPLMKKPSFWKILDCFIAFVMFSIAYKLAISGKWI